ncbi:MAG TPA: heme o synthase [Anaerolineaceae bacterium]|nr:heme o synthase [Anaerolineaceae bacterium]
MKLIVKNNEYQPELVNTNQNHLNSFRYFLLATSIVTFLLIVVGYIVSVSAAANACPDWPTCFGGWGVPIGLAARLQVLHRGLAALSTVMILASAILGWRNFRSFHRVNIALYISSGLMLVQIIVGAFSASLNYSAVINPIHLGLALASLGLLLSATVAVFYPTIEFMKLDLKIFQTPFNKLSLITVFAIFILMINGTLIASLGASQSCSGWPLCNSQLPVTPLAWLELSHLLVVAIASLLVTAQFLVAWRSQRSQRVVLTAVTGAFILFFGEVLIGALKVARGFPTDLVGLHAAASSGLWAAQVIVVAASGLSLRTREQEMAEANIPLPFGQRLRDFFTLSKPVIVLLLLVTTYAGMVVGGRKLPGLSLTFWTMLGGALAAGGASAINQYIDRDLDRAMQRTSRRPLPAGRLMPAEGLAYGLGACLAAFFLLAGFVNLLAAVLSLAGMIYYVLLYSIWLKRLTVQNIVIGGGAGAIPPLVGWAAASGSLNIPSLFLFAIIFLWTPPHFWALAIVRRNDYARGGVPMLPVVRGEKTTRLQILIYTIELVALTLVMPIFHMAGSLYLVSAILLGAWMLYSAWRVYKTDGNKTAWLMYRYSSMYLALLFLALALDVLI